MTTISHAPTADDVEPCANEALDRFLTGTVTAIPFLALIVVVLARLELAAALAATSRSS